MTRNIIFVLVNIFIFVNSDAKADTLVFGIVPQQSAKKLAETWVPLLNKISNDTGNKIIFATAKDIPTFEQRLANKEYDIAYMNPYHYVVYSEQVGYQALAKQRNKKIQGIIVVHKNSEFTSLQELHNKTLAFPAPAAFAASIIPQAVMQELGIKVSPKYVSSHDSVYLNVYRQFSPAGGGVMRTLNATPENVRKDLKVLWRSNKFTPHSIATAPNISHETRQQLLTALLSLNDKPEYQPLLRAIGFNGFESASNQDWDDVRQLSIQTSLPEGQ